MQIFVVAIDKHPVVLSGLRASLESSDPALRLVKTATTVSDVLKSAVRVDVALLETTLGDRSLTPDNIAALRERGAAVIIYTDSEDHRVLQEVLSAGARGIVLKSCAMVTLCEAIREVNAGKLYVVPEVAHVLGRHHAHRPKLSQREVQVLISYSGGSKGDEVADALGMREGTVRVYLKRIRAKYADVDRRAGTRIELYQRAIEDGLIEPPRQDES